MTTESTLNTASLAEFSAWAASQQEAAFLYYKQRLHYAMSNQQPDQLTQRAMLDAVELVFRRALAKLDELPFETPETPVERDRSALTPKVQAAFDGFIPELFNAVVEFNRKSCALSNFPDEHRLSKEYTEIIFLDIAAVWQEFLLRANNIFLSKMQP
jgi:monoamine oxidase